jgi:Lrp/AsnC family transcriptional regulator, regulator for asnA, asnC and gidA
MQPDTTDWKIIEILRKENTPNNAIAKELGLTEGTVRQRLKKLREAGILKIRALTNPEVLGNQQLAYISANVAKSKLLDKKAQELADLPQVLSVSLVAGQYDLMIEVMVDSNKGLMRFITEELSTIDGLAKTETFLTLKSYKKFI